MAESLHDKISLRPARPADAASLAALSIEVWGGPYLRQGVSAVCAEGAMPPAGAGSAVEIATLYVQPRHQGRGLGRALLQAGLRRCAELGGPAPWLATNAQNTAAIGFYQGQGFVVTGQTHFQIKAEAYLNEVLTYQGAAL